MVDVGLDPSAVSALQIKSGLFQKKSVREGLTSLFKDDFVDVVGAGKRAAAAADADASIAELRDAMLAAAEALDFEHAAELRDQVLELERITLGLGSGPLPVGVGKKKKTSKKKRRRKR